jgi:hypothetical protein
MLPRVYPNMLREFRPWMDDQHTYSPEILSKIEFLDLELDGSGFSQSYREVILHILGRAGD